MTGIYGYFQTNQLNQINSIVYNNNTNVIVEPNNNNNNNNNNGVALTCMSSFDNSRPVHILPPCSHGASLSVGVSLPRSCPCALQSGEQIWPSPSSRTI
jgi:hypothetical protein